MNEFETETANEPAIGVFIVEGHPLGPVMYFGEIYYDVEDTERNKVLFKKAIVKVLDTKTNTSKWLKVPTAGKDSLVQLDTRMLRGVLIKDIDQDEIAEYKEASSKLYSKLHLA